MAALVRVKTTTLTLAGVVLVLSAALALTIALVCFRPQVSLSLVEYRRWPHGAILRLNNGTQTTIRYLAEYNDTPAGEPVLCLQKTPDGWTNASPTVKTGTSRDPRTGKAMDIFYFVNPAALPKPGDRLDVPLIGQLKPGRSVSFFVRMEPGMLPKKVGTLYYLPQSALARKLQTWLLRIQRWCRIETSPLGQREIWCPTPLYLSSEASASGSELK